VSRTPDDTTAYRNPLRPLLDAYEVRRERGAERARSLGASARAELSRALRRDLEGVEARLVSSPSTREELELAERALALHEKLVDAALSELAERRERRALDEQLRPGARRQAAIVVLVVCGVALGLVGWGWRADQERRRGRQEAFFAGCRERPECASQGLCGAPPRDQWNDAAACVAVTNADCSQSTVCKERGACSAEAGVCRALSNEDCAGSQICAERAECTAERGACHLRSSADCQRSAQCRRRGECSYDSGACRVLSRADCAKSDACFFGGECSADQGACRAVKSSDCSRSIACQRRGECGAHDGKCVASDEGCSATAECRRDGRCSAVGGVCAPRTLADCEQSYVCKQRGLCAPSQSTPPMCQATALGCRASSGCKQDGACTLFAGTCVVGGAADCHRSELCNRWGPCTVQRVGDTHVCVSSRGPRERRVP
jgi:hypothetical protein